MTQHTFKITKAVKATRLRSNAIVRRKKKVLARVRHREAFKAYGTSEKVIDDFLYGAFIVKKEDERSIAIITSAFEDHGVDFSPDLAIDIGNAFEKQRIDYALESKCWYHDGYFIKQ